MVFVGMVQTMYPEAPAVTFVDWMEIGVPFVLVMLPITWLFLTRTFGVKGSFTGSDDVITTELEALGPMQPGEKRVLGIFVCTGLGWIFRDVWATSLGVDHLVHDTTVAVLAALMLFMTFITEINSNTATASIFLPVLATMAAAGHMHPFLLMIFATFACSCAFMLSSGTEPNAVIFGSGHVTIPQMSRAGLRMNFISVAVLSLVMVLFAIPLLGISGTPPSWATMP